MKKLCLHCKDEYEFLAYEIIDGRRHRLNREEKKYCPYCRAVLLDESLPKWPPRISKEEFADLRRTRGAHIIHVTSKHNA